MLEIDGAEGGGQILRSALSLSALTGRAVHIDNVRGNRPTPGLKPQHLSAVKTLADICTATVDGDELESETVTFDPGEVEPGHYEVDIGTAGSLTLLFDAVLPLGTCLNDPIRVTAHGGTDVKWSPPVSHYRAVKLPFLRSLGVHAAVDVHRTGFYPAGGGEATLTLGPSSPTSLDLTTRGQRRGVAVYSKASSGLADSDVAQRQADAAVSRLSEAGFEILERRTSYVDARSPGSVVTVESRYEHSRAGFDALGERGTPAETVADRAVEDALDFETTDATVDEHLADQLLVFLALAGGRLSIPEVTAHVASSVELLSAFGFDIAVPDREAAEAIVTTPGV
jgi:RNA 3'-terminal phosphate cyclase (ATP)